MHFVSRGIASVLSLSMLTQIMVLFGTMGVQLVEAFELDISSTASVKQAASTAAYQMMLYYGGNQSGATPGILGDPYYWWEAGGMFGSLVEYYYYTGDSTYNNEALTALQFQAGPNADYMPSNQSKDEGNDDQSFWGMAAMSAAETNFPNPAAGQPGWVALAQAVFNEMSSRWDTTSCGGGLRWQIYTFNSGYTYKNSISNGALFNLGARLARYTGNSTYADVAMKVWNWETSIGLMDSGYNVYDGSSDTDNCSSIDHIQWTYNAGIWLFGAAMMYNYTNGSAMWETHVNGILKASSIFFENQVMYEEACEISNNCDTDQLSFKAYFLRWLAATTKIASFSTAQITPWLQSSAKAAAAQCTGGTSGDVCGSKWPNATYDGTYGVGQQMSALQAMGALLVGDAADLVTNTTGGTSQGNAAAGSTGTTTAVLTATPVATTADRVGAGFLTAIVLVCTIGGVWFAISD